jgi:hypothetical protein
MPPAAPTFLTFDDWKRMSEREQDAWLDRLDRSRRRGTVTARLLIGFGSAAAAAAVAGALVLWSVGS